MNAADVLPLALAGQAYAMLLRARWRRACHHPAKPCSQRW